MRQFDHRRTWGPTPAYPHVLAVKSRPESGLIVLAGPCSVESDEQVAKVVPVLKDCRVTYARGGVYRAGTYPKPTDLTARGNQTRKRIQPFGLQTGLLRHWADAVRKAGLRTIVEVLDIRQTETIDRYADAFQVGARHMQDYALLKKLSRSRKVVALKRAPGATLDEFLGAAEYLAQGACSPILIERGSATHMNHVRWDLSVSLIAAAKRMTGLPVLVDASHGTGRSDLVVPMTLAGVAAGADGFLVEVHPDPGNSLSDADQALRLSDLWALVNRAEDVRHATTKAITRLNGVRYP